MKCNEISEMQEGMPIPSFTGKIKVVYDKKGPDGYGKFKQDIVVEDSTGSCWMVLAGTNQVDKNDRGKIITVTCSQGKSGPQGVKAKLNSWQGKSDMRIWVTDSAKMNLSDEGGAAQPQEKKQEYQQRQTQGRHSIVRLTDEYIESYATAWVHTYEVASPIFSKVLSNEEIPDRVTAIMISAGYGQNYEFTSSSDESWKEFVYSKSGAKLGDLDAAKLAGICAKLLAKKPRHEQASAALSSVIHSDARGECSESVNDIARLAVVSAYSKDLSSTEIDAFFKANQFDSLEGVIGLLSGIDGMQVPDYIKSMAACREEDDEVVLD